MLKQLFSRRVLIVVGKGGVGKTTISAALGLAAAESGRRVLLMECDERAPIAAAFGKAASFEPIEIASNLSTMVLEGRHSLEEYLRIVLPGAILLRAVFANRLYQFFVQTAPGLRELMMLGKIYYEAERKHGRRIQFDLIILDAPASGQALSLLRMPTAARETFRESIVGHEASHVARMLRDKRICATVQVTTGDALAITEALETHATLAEMHLAPVALLFNRVNAESFDSRDIAIATRRGRGAVDSESLEYLADLANRELGRINQQRKALAKLRGLARCEVVEIREHRGLLGAALASEIASELARWNPPSRATTLGAKEATIRPQP